MIFKFRLPEAKTFNLSEVERYYLAVNGDERIERK